MLQGLRMAGWIHQGRWEDCTEAPFGPTVPVAARRLRPTAPRRLSCPTPSLPPRALTSTTSSRTTDPAGNTNARCVRRWVNNAFLYMVTGEVFKHTLLLTSTRGSASLFVYFSATKHIICHDNNQARQGLTGLFSFSIICLYNALSQQGLVVHNGSSAFTV